MILFWIGVWALALLALAGALFVASTILYVKVHKDNDDNGF